MSTGSKVSDKRQRLRRILAPIGQCLGAALIGTYATRHAEIPLIVPYLAVMLAFGLLDSWFRRNHPDVVTELVHGGAPLSDRMAFIGGGLLLALHFIVAMLDGGYFHWTRDSLGPISLATQWGGLILMTAGNLITCWAMLLNPFFSPIVRVQQERGHQVISTGPYAVVRHPAYTGVGLAALSSGVALGSLWSIMPVCGFLLIYAWRTTVEEKKLAAELPGFTAYSHRVRYRLLPGVW